MDKKTIGIIIAIVVVLGLGGIFMVSKNSSKKKESTPPASSASPSTETPSTNQPEAPAVGNDVSTNVSVEIKDFAFAPTTLTVSKGTTVVWTNKDSVAHTVTPDQASDNFEGSELLGQNESYQYTFNTAGTYTYHCQPHPNMKAKVVVTE